MRVTTIIILSLLSITASAGNRARCERNVAAKILTINEVDQRLEGLSRISNSVGKIPTKEEVIAVDRENSIYFHAYQMAESVCTGVNPTKKLPPEDD